MVITDDELFNDADEARCNADGSGPPGGGEWGIGDPFACEARRTTDDVIGDVAAVACPWMLLPWLECDGVETGRLPLLPWLLPLLLLPLLLLPLVVVEPLSAAVWPLVVFTGVVGRLAIGVNNSDDDKNTKRRKLSTTIRNAASADSRYTTENKGLSMA